MCRCTNNGEGDGKLSVHQRRIHFQVYKYCFPKLIPWTKSQSPPRKTEEGGDWSCVDSNVQHMRIWIQLPKFWHWFCTRFGFELIPIPNNFVPFTSSNTNSIHPLEEWNHGLQAPSSQLSVRLYSTLFWRTGAWHPNHHPNQPTPLISDHIVHNDHDGINFKSHPLLWGVSFSLEHHVRLSSKPHTYSLTKYENCNTFLP